MVIIVSPDVITNAATGWGMNVETAITHNSAVMIAAAPNAPKTLLVSLGCHTSPGERSAALVRWTAAGFSLPGAGALKFEYDTDTVTSGPKCQPRFAGSGAKVSDPRNWWRNATNGEFNPNGSTAGLKNTPVLSFR